MPVGRVFRPIRQRRRRGSKRPPDPNIIGMTRAVGIVCLGFLGIFLGILLTLFGLKGVSEGVKTNDPMIIVGPIFFTAGLTAIITGAFLYRRAYLAKKENDKNLNAELQATPLADTDGYLDPNRSFKQTMHLRSDRSESLMLNQTVGTRSSSIVLEASLDNRDNVHSGISRGVNSYHGNVSPV